MINGIAYLILAISAVILVLMTIKECIDESHFDMLDYLGYPIGILVPVGAATLLFNHAYSLLRG